MQRLRAVLVRTAMLAATVLLLVSAARPTFAVPAAPDSAKFRQPNGATFVALLWGDEWQHGHETADGYTILLDETTGYWHFAQPGPAGTLQLSPLRPGIDAPTGLQRGIRGPKPAIAGRPGALPNAQGAETNLVPSLGTANVPVLLVNFNDTSTTYQKAAFESLLFGTGTFSLADYYTEVSYGKFTYSAGPGGIAGWYTASQGHDYYGANVGGNAGTDTWPGDLVYEAAAAANAAGYNFAPYDNDGDCYVDNVVIIHQGGGEEFSSANVNNIWSHSWDLDSAQYFGRSNYGALTTNSTCTANPSQKVKVSKYTIQPELYGTSTHITTVGVFAHELGHALGLPDLYDTDKTSQGVGNWSLMGSGNWNRFPDTADGGNRPGHLDPWSKWSLRWMVPTAVTCPKTASLPAADSSSAGFFALRNGSAPFTGQGEYFLVENRQKTTTTFDAGLPGDGLLIWHVDNGMPDNKAECHIDLPCNATRHYRVALMQADNLWHMEKNTDTAKRRGDPGDPYPGTWSNTIFDDFSLPSAHIYAGTSGDWGVASGVQVTNISDSGPEMRATMSAPGPCVTSFTPPGAGVGGTVGVTGSRFTGATAVRFNGTNAVFSVTSDTLITATVPGAATSGPISVVSAAGHGGSATSFTVLPPPTITGFTPAGGAMDAPVTITGTHFTGATSVTFGGSPSSFFTVDSDTQITALVPSTASTGRIAVTAPGGTATSATDFIFYGFPGIMEFHPTSGPAGSVVNIIGFNFTAATAVRFNGTNATFTVTSDTAIAATVPNGATTGKLTVVTPGGTATSTDDFTIAQAADLKVTMLSASRFAIRGSNVVYTYKVENLGPATATAVEVYGDYPSRLGPQNNTGECGGAGFPCSLGDLAVGATRTITTTLGVPVSDAHTDFQFTARAESSRGDLVLANNSASATTKFGAFFTLSPCRLVDTRMASNPNGPPALQPQTARTFTFAGTCSVPAGATALGVNVTITGPSADGYLQIYPSDSSTAPLVSTVNFKPGLTRANNAIIPGSADGNVGITVYNASSQPVQLIMDVNGYFE